MSGASLPFWLLALAACVAAMHFLAEHFDE